MKHDTMKEVKREEQRMKDVSVSMHGTCLVQDGNIISVIGTTLNSHDGEIVPFKCKITITDIKPFFKKCRTHEKAKCK